MKDSTSSTFDSAGDRAVAPAMAPVNPREHVPAWKWKGSMVVGILTTLINGYDVSNVANIQACLYEAFGSIELLPWIGLSYSLASFAVLGLSRKILYCVDMRWIYIANAVIFMVGAAVAGSAQNMSSVIVGRIIMGVAGAIVYQCNLTFVAVFASPVLFAVALEFSGSVWSWSSGSTIAVWIVFGLVTIAWALQQTLCILTTPDQRSIPLHLLTRLDLLPLWVASGCAGASYAVTLCYTPLFFAFARGHDALQQTVCILPFILVFIVVVILVATIAGAAAMAKSMNDLTTPESQLMGLEALIGIGLGCSFQHVVGISNVINKAPQDRVDSAILFSMAQMGAIAIVLSVAGSIFQNV
ncbi:major facilitator superfamily domain-containing protein [Aspergillus spectabilis]